LSTNKWPAVILHCIEVLRGVDGSRSGDVFLNSAFLGVISIFSGVCVRAAISSTTEKSNLISYEIYFLSVSIAVFICIEMFARFEQVRPSSNLLSLFLLLIFPYCHHFESSFVCIF